jgi:hypothetical protein
MSRRTVLIHLLREHFTLPSFYSDAIYHRDRILPLRSEAYSKARITEPCYFEMFQADSKKLFAEVERIENWLQTDYLDLIDIAYELMGEFCPDCAVDLPHHKAPYDVDPEAAAKAMKEALRRVLAIKEAESEAGGESEEQKTKEPALVQYLAWLGEFEAENKLNGISQAAFARDRNEKPASMNSFLKIARDHLKAQDKKAKSVKSKA